jgi:hypothetical protein
MFPRVTALAVVLTLFALALSGAAHARPHLRDNKPINDQLFIAAVGNQIRENCPSIEARMTLVYSKGLALYNYALGQGYSKKEISDYLESKPDIRAMETRAADYLAGKGVRLGDAESYCKAGEAEIAANSPIGELLRSR